MSIDFKHATLPNGLTVIGEIAPSAHSAAIGFFVKTGARDESASVMGVSHFLEHMMFKGTQRRSAADVDLDFDNIGADHNAFTTTEMTAFWAHCLPEQLPVAEDILADIMRPALRGDDFEDEKKVILEEIAMYQDHPYWVLYERAMEVYFGAHPLSHRVLGTPETVIGMSRDEMAEYFGGRYSADNTVVTMAGRVDFDAMVQRLGEHCGTWPNRDAVRAHPSFAARDDSLTIESASTNRHYALLAAPAPALDDDARYAAGMLMQILGDVEGSRLYWALIETGLAEEAQAYFDGRDGLGTYLVYASCSPTDAERVEDVMLREVDALVDSLTEDDLERARSRTATAATLAGELPAGRMRRLGRVWLYSGAYRSLEDEIRRLNEVTLDELRAVHAAFPVRPRVLARLTPET
ncbi:MAG: insulinase family protein [Planctomycetes bacterium]|nr:insulinase family protein [Planctomycetota bacterium]